MSEHRLELVDPTMALREAYVRFADEFRAAGETAIPGCGGRESVFDCTRTAASFTAFVLKLRDAAKGRGQPVGYVPGSTYWLVRDGQAVVGTSNLRHSLTPLLMAEGGHVGYAVCPSQRRKGHGTELLRLTLDRARGLGITRVLVTCDADNVASAGVIRNNGGVLQDEVAPAGGSVEQRYWIDL